MAATEAPGRITFSSQPNGSTRAELIAGGESVSRLWIIPFTVRVGAAAVRMDGIGGVSTDEAHRHRGYSRRVLEEALRRMGEGDAGLSMLYGIPDFYPRFGYATAGPDHLLTLPPAAGETGLPEGWDARPFSAKDLPAVRRLYENGTARAAGAAVREPEAFVWSRLLATTDGGEDSCRVVVDASGRIGGYAWRGTQFWYARQYARRVPEAFVIGEAVAESREAGTVLLAACRRWAAEASAAPGPAKQALLFIAPEGPLAVAATRAGGTFSREYVACGGSMARVLNAARLLRSLEPELTARVRAAERWFTGTLRLATDLGVVNLRISPDGVAVAGDGPYPGTALTLALPQSQLARLALGAFPPGEILADLPETPPESVLPLVEILFPPRHPHMSIPDRF
jgi:hypothetical protein